MNQDKKHIQYSTHSHSCSLGEKHRPAEPERNSFSRAHVQVPDPQLYVVQTEIATYIFKVVCSCLFKVQVENVSTR